MDINEQALLLHKKWGGKIATEVKSKIRTKDDLTIAYTPGVAAPCMEIAKRPDSVYDYTIKNNTIAIVTDGSAVLGLGNIGAKAALPVMEGKAVLFKEFGDLNAFPLCIETQDPDEIITIVKNIAPGFGGINLEDISAPRCFYIEETLKKMLDIPVFHDDQHGTAVVVLAGIINALKICSKQAESCKVIVNGAGAAGIAISKLLLKYGFKNIILCDKRGAISDGEDWLNPEQYNMSKITNPNRETGDLKKIIRNADIFIGVSAPDIVSEEMIKSMNAEAIVFAMANPIPEIMPDRAKRAGARIVGTGRSDFPNQVNNVLAFPGILKAAVHLRKQITDEVKIRAATALADFIPEDELCEDKILPFAFEEGIADYIAEKILELY
ncbi:MAG TPA: NADP-dependent malic enzyme [Thermotogota bacterium]|nr:NADP-dependent malic enzyme [Thermotogota bacterium]HPJ87511.1 NADP-dependent malic enzyme [Thermotogota bacterium]HPR94716.1 NADP-dependent malic enzyme [Thermotogota bacterium]